MNLNIQPHNLAIYESAFTHSSYNSDAHTKHKDYEKTEFLGDAVIGFVVASLLFEYRKELTEGQLSQVRSALVKSKSLANLARKLNLHEYIKVGNAYRENIYDQDHLLEDVFEAFIGAIYLDQGIKKVTAFLNEIFLDLVKNYQVNQAKDPKSKLQELIQGDLNDVVRYEIISSKGPSNNPTFTAAAKLDGMTLGTGTGRTKKEAEFNAALDALERIATNNGANIVSKK